jgi:hypothetical protein
MMSRVVQLWTSTAVLADPEVQWTLEKNDTSNSAVAESITERNAPHDHAYINAQLRAIVEKHASRISDNAAHWFDFRLIARSKPTIFESFLAGFILLNCAERLSWLLKLYQTNDVLRGRWGSPVSPETLLKQGIASASVAYTMIRIRYPEFKLVDDPETGLLTPHECQEDGLKKWFASAGLTKSMVARAASNREDSRDSVGTVFKSFDANDYRSLDGTLSVASLQTFYY